MKQALKILALLVPLSIFLSCEKEERIPRIVTITSIEVLECSTLRNNGTTWDPFDNPDIYPQIVEPLTKKVIYTSPTKANNIEGISFPIVFAVTPNLRITDATMTLEFQLYDYDTFTVNELMFQGLFTPYTKGTPSSIEVGSKGNGYWAKLNVKYEY